MVSLGLVEGGCLVAQDLQAPAPECWALAAGLWVGGLGAVAVLLPPAGAAEVGPPGCPVVDAAAVDLLLLEDAVAAAAAAVAPVGPQ